MFGLYVHIPYCLQKCHYCDFVTFEMTHKIKMDDYTQLLLTELQARAHHIESRHLTSIYLGGGTPSLMPIDSIRLLLQKIKSLGFTLDKDIEFTIEINPGTIDEARLDEYLSLGVNRFSVGVQTFNNSYLQNCGREHSAQDSRTTLKLLKNRNVNYSFDLLFGLPHQAIADLNNDLDELLDWAPPHVSLYNMTVPQAHKMNLYRAEDSAQAEMFSIISNQLQRVGIHRYELSNFSKPGFESKHNMLYWTDNGYWGIGVSAHSYLPSFGGPWGTRFWNSMSASGYEKFVSDLQNENTHNIISKLPLTQIEILNLHESLTDFCHTSLRTIHGLKRESLLHKFGEQVLNIVLKRLDLLVQKGWLKHEGGRYVFTSLGWPLANQIFLELTFLKDDVTC